MRVNKYKMKQPITVHWVDIVDDPSWRTIKDMIDKTVCMVEQPGYFITNKYSKEKGHMLIMATALNEDGDGGYVVIPWGCIREVDTDGNSKD